MARDARKSRLHSVDGEPSPRRNRVAYFEIAYQRLEDALINCELRPGSFMAMQDLQVLTGLGRTPVHHAVNRLSADTLILIRPRHGIQIAPIDLARERMLLRLRRDLERFVIQLATERSGPSHRNQLLHMERLLREKRKNLGLQEFNKLDRGIDHLLLAAAGEPFLEHTLRPLHTIFRRIGFIHHTHIPQRQNLEGTVHHHLAIISAVANRHVEQAIKASDALMDFVDSTFDVIEAEVDPVILDCSIEPLLSPHGVS